MTNKARSVSVIICACLLVINSTALAESLKLKKVWQISGFFSSPESVTYDSKRDVLYVSNQNTVGTKKMNGYISMVSTSGKVLKDRWVIGMDQPYGMDVENDTLWVADITGLLEIDIPSATVINRWDPPEGMEKVNYNGLVVAPSGDVYVSDFWRHVIWKLSASKKDKDGKRVFGEWLALKGNQMVAPNGLCINGNALYVAGWGWPIDEKNFTTKEGAKLMKISLSDKSVEFISGPIGNLDGLQNDGNGNYLVSDWIGSRIFRISADGKITLLGNLSRGNGWKGSLAGEPDAYHPGLADIEYVPEQKRLYLPLAVDGGVACYEIQ